MTGREPGISTEDLHTARVSPPGRPDNPLHRTAHQLIIGGTAILVLTVLLALTAWIISSGDVWADTKGHFFAELGFIVFAMAGSGLIACGVSRRSVAEVLDRVTAVDAAVERNLRRLDHLGDQVHRSAETTAAASQALTVRVDQLAAGAERHAQEFGPMVKALLGQHAAMVVGMRQLDESLSKRLDDIEKVIEKVPDYGQAVLDGIEMQRKATSPDGF